MLKCVAVRCSVLQYVAGVKTVCCSILQCIAEHVGSMDGFTVCCSMLQYVAVCCSVSQCAVLQCVAGV